jgi:biopolymer transport protein ExbB/TolQ
MDNFITKHRIGIAKTISILLDLIFGIGIAFLATHFGLIYLLLAIPTLIIDVVITRIIYKKMMRRQI